MADLGTRLCLKHNISILKLHYMFLMQFCCRECVTKCFCMTLQMTRVLRICVGNIENVKHTSHYGKTRQHQANPSPVEFVPCHGPCHGRMGDTCQCVQKNLDGNTCMGKPMLKWALKHHQPLWQDEATCPRPSGTRPIHPL